MQPALPSGGAGFFIFAMVRKWFVVLSIACSTFATSQVNLVLNSSFEDYDTCPNNQDQVYYSPPWIGYASADYWNSCGTTAPNNWAGYQYARTGAGYVGLAAYAYYYNGSCPDCREYVSGELSDSLKEGHKYCVEFYTSLSDCSFWAVNRLGIYFSSSPVIYDNQGDTISLLPQVQSDTTMLLTDTANWIKISGIFTANGGEKYIMLGNFYDDDDTDTLSGLGICIMAYYYIDDVAVYELAECNAGNDISICYKDNVQIGISSVPNVVYEWTPTAGLSDPNISNPFASPDTTTFYVLKQTECDAVSYDTVRVTVKQDCHSAANIIIPTIVYGWQEFFITGLESNSRLELYDVRGRLIFSAGDYENNFQFTGCEQAVYCAVLTRPNGEQLLKKVLFVQ